MINNTSPQKWERLEAKSLDSQFKNNIINGMSCSPFEADAILTSVHKVYEDFFDNNKQLRIGQIQFVILATENGASKKLTEATKITATLTLDDGENDLKVIQRGGVIALRRHRLQRICNEAFEQGGLLTVEDIANRIFCCAERTVTRDLKDFRDMGISLPLRSTIKDMGRTLSHRKLIIEKWLQGQEYSEIVRSTNHSIDAINNYVGKFKKVVSLYLEHYQAETIAFFVKISSSLVKTYIQLWEELDAVSHRKEEVLQMAQKKNQTQ